MISVAPIGKGLVTYLMRIAHEDYYFDGGEPPGIWIGSACPELAIFGDVDRKTLRSLTLGYGPDGQKLVQNAGRFGEATRNRQLGISYVFNAPKSWSVKWAFATPELQRQMENAFVRAITRTVREYIEPEIARCRMAEGTEVRAKLIGALFTHATSREGDMHAHGHLLIPNEGICADSRTRALVSKRFYDRKLDAGAYFRLALEHESQKLGMTFHRPLDAKGVEKPHIEVSGVPEHVCRHFSKRREQIERQLDAKGLQSAEASAVATMQTRRTKETVPARPQLRQRWLAEAQQHHLPLDWNAHSLEQRAAVNERAVYAQSVRQAIRQCTQNEAHFQRKDILRESLVSAQAKGGVDPWKVYTLLNHDLETSQRFVNLGIRANTQSYTVPRVLRIEKQLLDDVERLRTAHLKPISHGIVDKAIETLRAVDRSQEARGPQRRTASSATSNRTFALDDEQKACVRYATQSDGRIKVILGLAGTSKTTVVAAASDAYRRAGWKTYGTALAGVAAKNLANETSVPSDTVRMTLHRLCPTTTQQTKHHLRQLARTAAGLPTYDPDYIKLNKKSVLFVDEASMIGTPDFATLTRACANSGAVLVLVGDQKQLPAIDQGGAFGSIVNRVGGFELQAIRRQESESEREKVRKLSRGEAESVLKSYAAEGKLHVARNHRESQKKLVDDWAKYGGVDSPRNHAILAATNIEVRELNDLAQHKRLQAGKLNPFHIVTLGGETFYGGDRLIFTKKSRRLQLENGDAGTIVSVRNNALNAAVQVHIDGEKTPREIPLRTLHRTHYDGLARGYAMTVHKMQSRTVDNAYCHLVGGMTDRELTYVAFSRHRKSLRIYTDENHAGVALTNLARATTGDGAKITAKPGLKEEYSPLTKQATASRAKTLATDHDQKHDLTITLEP